MNTPFRNLLMILVFACLSTPLWAESDSQVTDLQAWHVQGQTFLTYREVNPPELPADADSKTVASVVGAARKGDKTVYRIYRSGKPITSLDGLEPIGTAPAMSCWNPAHYAGNNRPNKPGIRFVVKEGDDPLPPGMGVYVHNPAEAGKAYYAVTVVQDGKENTDLLDGNTTADAVTETVGQGVPVLQRTEKPDDFAYIKKPEIHYYVRWEAPPNSSVENRPLDYIVGIPPNIQKTPTPVGLHLHCWGGSMFGGYGWWYSQKTSGDSYLIASNQIPYDWWTGYHEKYYSEPRKEGRWKDGVIHPYSTTRMLSFLDWAAEKYDLDLKQVFTAGNSMGGSGSPMFAIRYPDRIAWAVGWVGIHDPANSPHFRGSYERVWGKIGWALKFQNGQNVWDYYSDPKYLRAHPDHEIGFITWSNGKNDGAIGWPQAVDFYQAMQETHRPHLFVWGLRGHGQRATMPKNGGQRNMPITIRQDLSLPAFTNCSLDDDPGTASRREKPAEVKVGKKIRKDPYDGDSSGQVNVYLYWETEDIVDTPNRWEMTVGLIDKAPEETCTVDITPRRLQTMKTRPGDTFQWSNTLGGKVVQSGEVKADQWGLVTLPDVTVSKKTNRVAIWK